jgi:hypothetical protein
MDDSMIIKCLVLSNPFTLQFTIYVVGTYMMSMLFRIGEGAQDRIIDEAGEIVYNYEGLRSTYRLAMWVTTITIPTVGYGNHHRPYD